ncbi:MAG: pyrroline-5-carboxylate reductase [Proteobacteria bacterium]|nr:pyrroline-5-carboxylate reductase [Pseudomonadota bacterium]MCP4920204.1 pyrroline-5-carboxylate reductase [Pseudomonadota bacterium]
MSWRLGFIGAGVMAETMIAGVLFEGVLTPDRVVASDPHASRREVLTETHGIRTVASNVDVLDCELIVLAVKPQSLTKVFAAIAGRIPADTQVLSIVAGAPIRSLQAGLGHQRVVRAMPNLPCRIHRGMTVWTRAEGVHGERIAEVLRGMGEEMVVDEERHIDRATAVSGTGPAIVAEFVKSMLEASNYIGMPRELSREAVLATLIGTAEMLKRDDDLHVAELIDAVTSPGGTTSRALQVLKQGRMGAVVTESIDAAYRRCGELGDDLEERLKES